MKHLKLFENFSINEALNKDIKEFGQDLEKNFKAAGFNILILAQSPTEQQLNAVKTKEKVAIFEFFQNEAVQQLTLHVSSDSKSFKAAEAIVNKFQLSDYNGPVLARGWTAKQVMGKINPGDIVKEAPKVPEVPKPKQKPEVPLPPVAPTVMSWKFYRVVKVDTKVKTLSSKF